jgi:hypothetical protein
MSLLSVIGLPPLVDLYTDPLGVPTKLLVVIIVGAGVDERIDVPL